MKIYITPFYLNRLIFEAINDSIDLHRESKRNCFYFGYYEFATDREVNDFVFSTPYFSDDLKIFLDDRENLVSTEVTREWLNKFIENVDEWAQSDEWLFYDVGYICNPLLNKNSDRKELDLTPYSKALFYCKKIV